MSMRTFPRIVPVVKGRGVEVPTAIPPVYNVAEFGEELVLFFPPNMTNAGIPSGGNRRMLRPDASAMGGVDKEILGTAAAPTATFQETFDFPLDMPAFIYLLAATVLARLIVGAGNTVDLSCAFRVQRRSDSQIVYNETVTLTGLTADSTIAFYMPSKGMTELCKQHDTLRMRVTITGTRTAGAANVQVGLRQCDADDFLSHVYLHLHPSLDHSQTVYGAQKAS